MVTYCVDRIKRMCKNFWMSGSAKFIVIVISCWCIVSESFCPQVIKKWQITGHLVIAGVCLVKNFSCDTGTVAVLQFLIVPLKFIKPNFFLKVTNFLLVKQILYAECNNNFFFNHIMYRFIVFYMHYSVHIEYAYFNDFTS